MEPSARLIEDDRSFVTHWNRLFKLVSLWLCLYPAIIIAAYEAYYWLRFAEFLDLDTYKTVPPRLLGFFYNFTNWDGVNQVIYKFLELPIFITLPIISFAIVFVLYQSVLAIYYLVYDSRMIVDKLTHRFSK